MALAVEAAGAVTVGASVVAADGAAVSSVTSSGVSPISGEGLAIATVKYAHATAESALTVEGRKATVRAPSR